MENNDELQGRVFDSSSENHVNEIKAWFSKDEDKEHETEELEPFSGFKEDGMIDPPFQWIAEVPPHVLEKAKELTEMSKHLKNQFINKT